MLIGHSQSANSGVRSSLFQFILGRYKCIIINHEPRIEGGLPLAASLWRPSGRPSHIWPTPSRPANLVECLNRDSSGSRASKRADPADRAQSEQCRPVAAY